MTRSKCRRRKRARSTTSRGWGATVVLLSLGLSLPWGAALAAQDASDAFSEAVDVRIVNVDVFATDRKGRFVSGLTKDDFVLEVDGTFREISHFQAYGGADTTEAANREPDGELSRLEGEETEHLVIYLDTVHLHPSHAARVLDDLERFAKRQVERGARLMLVTYGTAPEIQIPFTRSADAVVAGFAALGKASSDGLRPTVAFRSALRGIEGLYRANQCPEGGGLCPCPDPCDCAWSQMLSVRDQYASEVSARHRKFRTGLGEIVSALGGVAGRKSVVYVSSGLEQYPGLDLLRYMSDVCPEYEREFMTRIYAFDATSAILDLAAGANANRVSIYALDAAGLATGLQGSAEYNDRRFLPSRQVDSVRRRNLQNSLFVLADETGAEAIFNANRPYEALDQMAVDLSRYYSLAFEPAGPPDGKAHTVRVRLREKRGNVNLRHRRSYRDKPAIERQAERTLAALHFGLDNNPHGATLALVPTPSTGEEPIVTAVLITIPLRPTASPSVPGDFVHLTLAIRDETGALALREKRVELAPSESGQDAHLLSVNLELEPGSYRLAAGLRDAAGVTSYIATNAELP